ncbi:hypothetical protein [Streptomyces adustus]|uniref:hypothetical protein n=1 Tax=Streptomyces adustus TaxID=1609272 RepID=UPI0012E0798C|nr:hypothetical protein [Streptomyces adustus]
MQGDQEQMTAYEREQAALAEMHRTYEEMDQAEYVQFMDEMDARDAGRATQQN